jgi:hypothetical protein
MPDPDLMFVIPTYRLRDVCETVEAYDESFWNSGHSPCITVFDDSTVANHTKYYSLLEKTKTWSDLFYVGPGEKEQFTDLVNKRLRDRKLEAGVRNLFRPSYGGNRNFALIYTLGNYMVSSDDDMRPHALIEDSPESLVEDEISRGKLVKSARGGYSHKTFDILSAFNDVLGKKVGDVPENFAKGELISDTAMDLETNVSKGLVRENSLLLQKGKVSRSATVKIAQTFRSGTSDVDAMEFVELYLDDQNQTEPDELNDTYVLVNFRPAVTNKNWRMDCGVAGYDNTVGLPPFFPTRLRFEDYGYRLWVRQPGIVAAHVDAAQTHAKNNYMRHPLAFEVFNEEVANLLKRKILESCTHLNDLTIEFGYEGEVTVRDSEEIIERITAIHHRTLACAKEATSEARKHALERFACNLEKAFYGFEADFFQQNLSRIVDDVVNDIRGAMELWPTVVEICYFRKHRRDLPQTRVRNHRRVTQVHPFRHCASPGTLSVEDRHVRADGSG